MSETPQPPVKRTWKQRLKAVHIRVQSLQGDPHYVAMGMASGVFIAVTPTIPFHMALSVALAFILKGSKPAAIVGAWFCNPLTVGPFYAGSYQVGMFLLGREINVDLEVISLQALLALGADVAIAMMVGGALLGIVPALVSYFLTYFMFKKIRARHEQKLATTSGGNLNASANDTQLLGSDIENVQKP